MEVERRILTDFGKLLYETYSQIMTYGCSGHALIRIIGSASCDIFKLMSICPYKILQICVRYSVPAPVSSLI
jgi:hypothetical protein